ncbi:hypothetical protein C6P40_005400, partial [Pichia californica]
PSTQYWSGSYTTTTYLTTSAINSDYIPVYTTMTIVEIPSTTSDVTHTYAWTGSSEITKTMTWTTTGGNGSTSTVTDTYIAVPEPSTQYWSGSYTTTTYLTTSAINSDYIPVYTTMTIVEVPSTT